MVHISKCGDSIGANISYSAIGIYHENIHEALLALNAIIRVLPPRVQLEARGL